MLVTWLSRVANTLPDWAVKSLEAILRDPEFNMKDVKSTLLSLRDLTHGPLKNVPKPTIQKEVIEGSKSPMWHLDAVEVVKQFLGIPEARAALNHLLSSSLD